MNKASLFNSGILEAIARNTELKNVYVVQDLLIADAPQASTVILKKEDVARRLSGTFSESTIKDFLQTLSTGGLAGALYSDPEWKKPKKLRLKTGRRPRPCTVLMPREISGPQQHAKRTAAPKILRPPAEPRPSKQKESPEAPPTTPAPLESQPAALAAPEILPRTFREALEREIKKTLPGGREALPNDVVYLVSEDQFDFQKTANNCWRIVRFLTSDLKNKKSHIIKLKSASNKWEASLVPEEKGGSLLKKLLGEGSLKGFLFTKLSDRLLSARA